MSSQCRRYVYFDKYVVHVKYKYDVILKLADVVTLDQFLSNNVILRESHQVQN